MWSREREGGDYHERRAEKETLRIKQRTSLSVEISQFKEHDFCGNLFSLLHFIAYTTELPKRLVPSFSKLGTLYAFFLIALLSSFIFINLNSDHKNITFTCLRRY